MDHEQTLFTRTAEAAIIDVAMRHGGVFRSDDAGEHLAELRASGRPAGRAWVQRNLAEMVASGRAIHIERGAYAIADAFGRIEPFALGGHTVARGYVSLWAAADFHRLTTQDVSTVSVVTDTPKRTTLPVGNTGYEIAYHLTAVERIFGWRDVEIGSTTGRMADVEKLLIDLLWFFRTPGTPDAFQTMSIWRAAFTEKRANAYLLVDYAVRMHSPSLTRRVGFMLDSFRQPGSDRLPDWRAGDRKPIALLPGQPSSGAVSAKWGVVG